MITSRQPLEKSIQQAIIALLRIHGAYVLRINSGAVPIVGKGGKRMFRGAVAGTPDIIACYKGKFVAIEVKRGKNEPTELQKARHEEIRRADGIVRVMRDPEEVIALLREVNSP